MTTAKRAHILSFPLGYPLHSGFSKSPAVNTFAKCDLDEQRTIETVITRILRNFHAIEYRLDPGWDSSLETVWNYDRYYYILKHFMKAINWKTGQGTKSLQCGSQLTIYTWIVDEYRRANKLNLCFDYVDFYSILYAKLFWQKTTPSVRTKRLYVRWTLRGLLHGRGPVKKERSKVNFS